ncbi:MAG: hypothetical protein RBS53_10720 [Bacteroidales bacterium]|nr:hypothetical protein [Bacteroidales bacterium]
MNILTSNPGATRSGITLVAPRWGALRIEDNSFFSLCQPGGVEN